MKRLAATVLFFCSLAPAFGQSKRVTVTQQSSRPSSQGPAQNFTGSVHVEPLFAALEPSRISGGLVTFEPGARTAWHTHPLGQVLIVTAGEGLVQERKGPVQQIREGDVVRIPVPLRNSDQQEAGALKYAAVMSGLDCHAKQVRNKPRLGERVVLGDPPHSSLTD